MAQTDFQTLLPQLLPGDVQLFNPLSGPITSLTQNTKTLQLIPLNTRYSDAEPLNGTPLNEYGRLSWHSLEPSEGQYDFSIIAQALSPCVAGAGESLCLPAGSAFGFRVMALNPIVDLDTNVAAGPDGYAVYSDLPAYLETPAHGWLLPVDPTDATQGHYFIPDWNDPFFLGRIKALLAALGKQLNGRPDIGWVDIGLYGSWGEWHTGGLPNSHYQGIPYTLASPFYALNKAAYLANTGKQGAYQAGTAATKNFIIDAHNAAFPDTRLLMLTDDGEALCHALTLPGSLRHIGLTRDSFGSSDWTYQFPATLPDCDTAADQALILDRWKTAPFGAEPYGNGSSPSFPCETFETDPATGAYNINEQVQQFHIADIRNGSACTGTWADLTADDQQAFGMAMLQSGYRLAPVKVNVAPLVSQLPARITIDANWVNMGAAPTYDAWVVSYSLWTSSRKVAEFSSGVDLRTLLPTGGTPAVFEDSFLLPYGIGKGVYELEMKVVDPRGYRLPMQLALQAARPGGYYRLGAVVIPGIGSP